MDVFPFAKRSGTKISHSFQLLASMAHNFLVFDSLQELEKKVPLIIQFRESLGFWMRGTCPQGEENFHHRFRNLMEDVKLANRSGDVI